MDTHTDKTRLNKYVSISGVCTRKDAVDYIKKGYVTVNNTVCYEPFYDVQKDDVVHFKGQKILPKKNYHYILLNKPKGVGESIDESSKNTTISKLLKGKTDVNFHQLFPLADQSCGLTILTDDEDMITKYVNHDNKYKSVFEIQLAIDLNDERLDELITIANKHSKWIRGMAHINPENKKLIGVEMIGGQAAQILAFFEDQNLKVIKCDRTFLKGLTKKDLKRGWSRSLTPKEVIFLKHF